VAASASWVSIGNRSGQGEASVSYSVAANAVPSPRSAELSVEGVRVELKQDAAPCRYAINPRDSRIGHTGGSVTVSVETLSGCNWTASSSASWLTITGGASGNASGTVTLLAAANSGSERSARATIAGETLTVAQDALPPAVPPPPLPDPTPTPLPPPTPDPTPTPPPAPQPPSPPPPSPPPQPEPPKPVDIKGTVVLALGACPDVAFRVAATTVIASNSTDYERGSCSDIRPGIEVEVRARPRSNGTYDADQIKFEKKGDRDD